MRAMQQAHLRAAAARGVDTSLVRPQPRKGKAATMPGRIGTKKSGKAKPKRMKPPKRLRARPVPMFAPCSTIDAPVHDGQVRPGKEGLVADKYWVWPNATPSSSPCA